MDPLALAGLVAAVIFGASSWYYQHHAHKSAKQLPKPGNTKGSDPQSSSIPVIDAIEARYRQHIVDTYQYLDFKGIVQLEKLPIRVSLDKVYVSLRARHLLPHNEEHDTAYLAGRAVQAPDLADALAEKVARRDQPLQSVQIEGALSTFPSMVLLGDPGAGKSTILKYLAVSSAKARTDEKAESPCRLPIILPVAAYAAALTRSGDLSIENYLPDYYREVRGITDDLTALFSSALASGKALILLDGLDEVTDLNQRVFIARRVQDFYNWHKARGNQFVITSRIVGYDEAPLSAEGLTHFVMLDFSRDEIKQFVSNWCSAFEMASRGSSATAHQSANDEQERLLAAICSNSSVERLAANPLLLTILALIHRQGTELPRRRVELYELYLKTLIGSWARARNLDGRPIGTMDEVEAVKLLAPLAYWMHSEKPSGTALEHEIRKQIVTYFLTRRNLSEDDAERLARQFLDDIRRFAGLLTERGSKAYGFVHLTFEEYLSGREIILRGQIDKQKSIDLICKHADDPVWREVIRLAVGYTSIVAKEEETAALLITGLLTPASLSESSVDNGHNVLIAAECLSDVGLEGVGNACWESVCSHLSRVLGSGSVPVSNRWRAGELLSVLQDPRFNKFEMVPEMRHVAGGNFKMGTEPEHVETFIEEVQRVVLPEDTEWVREYWVACLRSEAPHHDLSVKPYSIGRYPVTNAQYKHFIDENPEYPVPFGESARSVTYSWDRKTRGFPAGRAHFPVVLVSWVDAMNYCRWLKQVTGRSFRLPTEAEWEYCARGRDGRIYPWGNDWAPFHTNTMERGARAIVAVGCYPDGVSPTGAFDCAGQVWEWTSTAWGKQWQKPEFVYPYNTDGREVLSADLWRIVRGGSWDDVAAFARCASRGPNTQTFRSHYVGFRVAEDID